MRKKKESNSVTIKDIAAHLGLAHSTVSRALSDSPLINAATKDRIRTAAQEFRYVANSSARSMRSGMARVVGLIVPDFQNEFYAATAQAMAKHCAQLEFQLILCISEDEPEREERQIRTLREKRVAGVLIAPCAKLTALSLELLKAVSTVQLLRYDKRLGSIVVRANDRVAISECTRHLLNIGHRRIGFIGPSLQVSTGRQRFEGFRDTIREAGIESDDSLYAFGAVRPEFGEAAFLNIHQANPHLSAIIVSSSRLVLGVLRATKKLGIRIPKELSLMVYGNADWFTVSTPSIAAVDLPIEEMSQAATKLLFESITTTSGVRHRKKITSFSTRLRVRGSTDVPYRSA